ncbi:MAG: hypothetical protein AB7O97_20990 [Planctomycetota bacterium]
MHFPSRLGALAVISSLGAFVSGAAAQVCAVRNSYRIANSHSGASSELNVFTPWVTAAPLSTPGFNDNPGAACWSHGSCTPVADYGYLRVSGAGAAQNCATGGVFLYLDQGPQASFRDMLTAVSSTLPHDTPVQVRITLTVAGHATLIDSNPAVSAGAVLSAGSLVLSVPSATGTRTGIVDTYVGSSTQVVCDLSTAVYAYGLLGLGIPPRQSSYSVDLTARVSIEVLTPGVSLTSCSGYGYPTTAAEVLPVGGGCGAGSPQLTATLPLLGRSQDYTLAGAAPGLPVLLGIAIGGAVGAVFGPCVVTADPTGLTLLGAGTTDASGGSTFGLPVPGTPSLVGVVFTAQELVLTNGGPLLGLGLLSTGVQSTVGS